MKGTPALPSATLAFRRGQRPSCQTPSQFLTLMMTPTICKFFLTWWLIQQMTGLSLSSMLDMAPNAFDDQYSGCVEEMEKKAPQLLQEDFNMNELLKLEWKKAEKKWNEIKTKSYPKGFNDYHGIALVAYTGKIHSSFNNAIRNFKIYHASFHFKAFHYYLTRALQLLSNQGCRLVYRGSDTTFEYKGKGSVRFGHFLSSSLSEKVAFSPPFFKGHGTKFFIKTCLGVYIKDFSYIPKEEEVLIPGYEVYQKVTIKKAKEYNEIYLDSPEKKKSNYNCFYSGSTKTDDISSSEKFGIWISPKKTMNPTRVQSPLRRIWPFWAKWSMSNPGLLRDTGSR
ncbi:T-cell ecto-ADP-ribosyltransferase 2-like isoform X2 [Apodemus sylvaticus]|uniref:T-cell ecto-ADP-ribosyltransferase 2-like isoform X2 n=1 Tax=Apodemus sylvaticus TaxID=10129 RepID=UPI0022427BF9|nr:T-cell ecto-ADP-ribosyltransferase 2-like isoform X2 [Apodemus sylvaticus]